VVENQQNTNITVNTYPANVPVLDDMDIEHDIIYESTRLENLEPIPPKSSIKIKGRIIVIKKGLISKV